MKNKSAAPNTCAIKPVTHESWKCTNSSSLLGYYSYCVNWNMTKTTDMELYSAIKIDLRSVVRNDCLLLSSFHGGASCFGGDTPLSSNDTFPLSLVWAPRRGTWNLGYLPQIYL